jgi:hypothetical protein
MTYYQERLVTYNNRLHPWSIMRMLPGCEAKDSQTIIHFRRRQDAEAHLQILRAKNPAVAYELIFDIMPASELTTKQELSPAYATQS